MAGAADADGHGSQMSGASTSAGLDRARPRRRGLVAPPAAPTCGFGDSTLLRSIRSWQSRGRSSSGREPASPQSASRSRPGFPMRAGSHTLSTGSPLATAGPSGFGLRPSPHSRRPPAQSSRLSRRSLSRRICRTNGSSSRPPGGLTGEIASAQPCECWASPLRPGTGGSSAPPGQPALSLLCPPPLRAARSDPASRPHWRPPCGRIRPRRPPLVQPARARRSGHPGDIPADVPPRTGARISGPGAAHARGETWLLADLHLGHPGIALYAARPFLASDVGEMDRVLVGNWRAPSGPRTGSSCSVTSALVRTPARTGRPSRRLQAGSTLVRGNHDPDLPGSPAPSRSRPAAIGSSGSTILPMLPGASTAGWSTATSTTATSAGSRSSTR